MALIKYPVGLLGTTFPVRWTPQFFNMPTSIAVSGAAIDLGLAATPLHTFELSYEFLRSDSVNQEFQAVLGFFLSQNGTLGRFLYSNSDDFSTTGTLIGVGDGTITDFVITRTLGQTFTPGVYPYGFGAEPVGMVDGSHSIAVYLNGTLQSGTTYDVISTAPANQILHFHSPPGGGDIITMDFQFFYYCRFADNAIVFERFLKYHWSVAKVTIQTCRKGA